MWTVSRRLTIPGGHQQGDEALIAMADIFRDTFRESDIIARMGGDEFAVLLIDTVEKNIAVIKSRLQANIDAFNRSGKASYRLSISTGVVIYDHERSRSIDDLLKEADELMYEEKERKRRWTDSSAAGKNRTMTARKKFYHQGLRFECRGDGKCCLSRGKYGYVYLSFNDRRRLAAHFKMTTTGVYGAICKKRRRTVRVDLP